MYTVYDFINNDIEPKHMKTGWKIEMCRGQIVLTYTVLNFDWKSLEFLGDEAWDMFLKSKSYAAMREKLDKAMKKHKRLHFQAVGLSDLKLIASLAGVEADIDKLVSKTIAKKSEKIKEENKEKERMRDDAR